MDSDGSWLIRLLLQRGIALIYLMGFLVALNQFRPLCGDHGLLPAGRFMEDTPFRQSPSIFYGWGGDRAYQLAALAGIALSLLALAGISEAHGVFPSMLVWFLLWVLYLSFVNIGQTFYSFGWESLLLESGFLAIFLGPRDSEAPLIVIWLYRWLAFRVMFGAGLIKWRGDPCWRDLTCLDYHFETQPMPNPLSRFFHRLPPVVRKLGVLLNHGAELIVPLLFFAPQPIAGLAALCCLLFLLLIIVSGNFAWLNWLTAILCLSPLDGALIARLLDLSPPPAAPAPQPLALLTVGLLAMVALKSVQPVKNLLSPRQIMNTSFDPLHLVNTYGAFGSITRLRYEIVLEGTDDAEVMETTRWKSYEFRGKPGDVARMPPLIAPYHLRLDWLMWFEAMPSRGVSPWFIHLVIKLLEGDRRVLSLLAHNPFPDRPPRFVRALYYRYSFGEKHWWRRYLVGVYLEPRRADDPTLLRIKGAYEW